MSSIGRLLPKSRSLINFLASVSTRFLRGGSGARVSSTAARRLVAWPGEDRARASSRATSVLDTAAISPALPVNDPNASNTAPT